MLLRFSSKNKNASLKVIGLTMQILHSENQEGAFNTKKDLPGLKHGRKM
jgi:hypothetical protein